MPEPLVEAATAKDWPEIRALMARSPMRGALPITLVRGASMEAAYPHWGARQGALVTRQGRAVVGFFHYSQQTRRVGEVLAPVLYFGDLRVDPGVRRHGIARALIRAALAQAEEGAYGLAYINSDNQPALRALQSIEEVRAQRVAAFRTHVMLALPSQSNARGFVRVTPGLRACESLCAAWAARQLGVVLDPEALRSVLANHSDIHFYARADAPESVAFAVWDMRHMRQVGLSPSPRWFEALRGLWGIAARVGLTHPLPEAPQAWRGADLVCCGSPLDAAAIAHARHVAFALGCHTLNAVSEANAQSASVMPSLGLSLETQAVLLSRHGQPAPETPPRPLFVDLRLV